MQDWLRTFLLTLLGISLIITSYGLYTAQTPSKAQGGYQVRGDTVFFFDHAMSGVNVASFEPLPYDYARDANFVYYDGRVVDGADPATFTVLGYLMAKDANAVYVYDRAEPLLDPARVEFLGNYYTRQGTEIHYKGRPTEIDPTTIEILPLNLAARDKNGIYVAGRLRLDSAESAVSEAGVE